MRVLLFTGKGGVGKTTAAAATAVRAASRGHKTLVLSTDPAHSLADALGCPLGPEPTELEAGLAALQVDPQRAFERTWREVQRYLQSTLQRAGVDTLRAEELTVLPGAEEVLALLAVRDEARSSRWDVIVVDCAPTGETLRLLSLPASLQWYVEKTFPAHRRALRSIRPLLARAGGPALPSDAVFAAAERLHADLVEVHQLLTGPDAAVRLVLTPEEVVVAETRRTLTALALYGYQVDALLANRVFGPSADPFVSGWRAAQQAQLVALRRTVAPLPVLEAGYQAAEPVGLAGLEALGAELYQGQDPVSSVSAPGLLLGVESTTDGFVLVLALPLAELADVDLTRSGDELVVTVRGHRRLISLPSVLRRCRVVGATLAQGRLRVRFEPDPALWRAP